MPLRVAAIIFAVLTLLDNAAFAQTYTEVPRSEDQSFNGIVKVSSEDVSRRTGGFVRELEVSFKWAGFFGQPVESYALRWQMGEVIRQSGKPPLRRSDLDKYPDLLERFDDLKPTEIILNTQVLAYSAQLSAENWRDYQPNNYARSSNPYFAQGTKTISRVPHLVIVRSGELGTDIIPSSPKNTQSFIKWNYLPSGADAEEAASNTLNLADRLRVSTLTIDTLEVPFAALDRIQKEYLKREKEEAEEEEDEQEEEQSENTSDDDDFWGDEDEEESRERKSNEDDFWACPDQNSDCWKKPEPKVAPKKKAATINEAKTQTFEIIKNDNREWGVRGAGGRMVIPFSTKLILSYKDGIAKAAEKVEVIPYTCVEGRGAFRGAALKSAYFTVWAEGLIDQNGKWIITPTKKGYFSGSDRRCRKFIPKARDHARANNIKITEDYEDYANVIGKMDGWRE